MPNSIFTRLLSLALLSPCLAGTAFAQMPVDGASDRRASDYAYFQSFGEPDLPFRDLNDAAKVRKKSDDYFETELATCEIAHKSCNPDTVYELADRFCQSLEFDNAVTWRTSNPDGDELILHWTICGLKK